MLLARLRHEDDYNRVNICLSLVATIFLPLSFVTGVFGMNFVELPMEKQRWSWFLFTVFCGAVSLGFVLIFWWRGWLDVVHHSHAEERRKAHIV